MASARASLILSVPCFLGLGLSPALQGVACAADAADPAPAVSAERNERAGAAFRRGVQFSQQGQYAEARASFLEAFALQPHALASYNAALACRALGDLPAALQSLDQALARPVAELTPVERNTATRERAEVAALLSAGPLPSPSPASKPAAATPTPEPIQEPPARATAKPPATAAANAPPKPENAAPPKTPPPVQPATQTSSYWLLGTGAVLAAGATGIWIYDSKRYDEWHLSDRPEEQAARDQLRESIVRWDGVAIAAGAAGAGLLLAGGILYWVNSPGSNTTTAVALGPSSVSLKHAW